MSIFDKDLITSESSFVKGCREWMMRTIDNVIHDYISYSIDNTLPTWDRHAIYIRNNVRFVFVENMRELEAKYNISATDTTIERCYDGKHAYVINVGVRLVGEKDPENYINIIKMPVISLHEKELINTYRKKYNYEPIR